MASIQIVPQLTIASIPRLTEEETALAQATPTINAKPPTEIEQIGKAFGISQFDPYLKYVANLPPEGRIRKSQFEANARTPNNAENAIVNSVYSNNTVPAVITTGSQNSKVISVNQRQPPTPT